jgi:holo-[acyl-carrier protein] synthase
MNPGFAPVDDMTRALGCGGARVGIDIVQVSRIAESLASFGERFRRRLFTAGELAYADRSPALAAERLAARFAAKEAALKAFDLCEAGIDWREIEVCRQADGACRLALHGKAAAQACTDPDSVSLSLSHDGDYAVAIVAANRSSNSSSLELMP